MAFDKLHDTYREEWPYDPFTARAKAEEVVLNLHRDHIFSFHQPTDQGRPALDLIIATRCGNGELALVKTSDTAAVLGWFYESVGTGKPLFEYWAHLLYHPTLSVGLMSHLSMLILREVKENVPGRGGDSYVMGLPKEAGKDSKIIQYNEQGILGGFPRSAIPLIVQCRNLAISDKEFEAKINDFVDLLRTTRQQERQFANANEITKYHLPLPDAPLGSEEATSQLAAAKGELDILQTGAPYQKTDDLVAPSTKAREAEE